MIGLVPISPVIFETDTSVIPDLDRIVKSEALPRSIIGVTGGGSYSVQLA